MGHRREQAKGSALYIRKLLAPRLESQNLTSDPKCKGVLTRAKTDDKPIPYYSVTGCASDLRGRKRANKSRTVTAHDNRLASWDAQGARAHVLGTVVPMRKGPLLILSLAPFPGPSLGAVWMASPTSGPPSLGLDLLHVPPLMWGLLVGPKDPREEAGDAVEEWGTRPQSRGNDRPWLWGFIQRDRKPWSELWFYHLVGSSCTVPGVSAFSSAKWN